MNCAPYEINRDFSSPNRNIAPLTTEVDEDSSLMIAGCKLSHLAELYGTPLYILDEQTIRASCRAYKEAMATYYPSDT